MSARLSIRDLLHSYIGAQGAKTWNGHDRLSTVGASEVGQCLRKTWFSKNEVAWDEHYVDRFGARLRGDLIEREYWVPGIRAALRPPAQLLFAGEEQRTLVDGYLSATPDGLIVGLERDCLSHLGVPDIGEGGPGGPCLTVECKSLDPRVDLKGAEKPEHSFQTQVQIGLIRHATVYRPEVTLLSYTDASFLDDVTEFPVRFDPRIYQAAKDRARTVMTTSEALALPAEGKLSGGDECKYCPWSSRCAHVTVAGIPAAAAGARGLGDNAAAELKALRDAAIAAAAAADEATATAAETKNNIKEFLRTHRVRSHKGDGWSVSWSSVKGRESVDLKAVEEAGVDLSRFEKVGDPSDRLVVK
jgi:hypothetical protein